MKRKQRQFLGLFLAGVILLGAAPVSAQMASSEIKSAAEYTAYSVWSAQAQENTGEPVVLTADEVVSASDDVEIMTDYQQMRGKSIATGENSSVTFRTQGASGWYTLQVTYYLAECRSGAARRQLQINDSVPFEEAADLAFYAAYVDEKGIMRDYYDNDIRSAQVASPRWMTVSVYDRRHYESEPLKFRLSDGDTITVNGLRETMVIHSITLVPLCAAKSYETATAVLRAAGAKEIPGVCDIYEAEKCAWKTDPTIVPTADNSSSTSPHSNYAVRLNTLNGANWKTAGQMVSWQVTVPEDGLYRITLKAKQNTRRGLYSTRRLYINGQVPFAEANDLRFIYTGGWENYTLGAEDGEWLFFLRKGENEIILEATLGEMGPVLREVNDILDELNAVYREILTITGSSPDRYRDYQLDKRIPDTIQTLAEQSARLTAVQTRILDITGQKGNDMSIFDTLTRQLDSFRADADKIPTGFSYFKTNIGSLATWITAALEQPLTLDYIAISSAEAELPQAKVGFFRRLWDSVVSFAASFTVDYNKIGNMTENNEAPITVWMTSGRDQMQVLKVLVQNSFVQETGINVQLENVETGAVLKSVAAGNGPDVLLGASVADPVNYALRNAVCPLDAFPGIETVRERFYPETLVPFTLGERLYALPEKVSFNVLYYRSDIMEQFDLALPETWDDVVEITSVLQKNSMTFGLPIGNIIGTYAMFMYQHGGEMYRDGGRASQLTAQKNADAFEQMTDFFKNYSLELSYNFVNRFRTAEIPLAIESIESYNNLKVSAPEIEGQWGIALLPGVRRADGTVDRTGYLSATSCFILNNSVCKENAFRFLDWWTDADTQESFGREIESILGPSSRYMAANREAFEKLPWTKAELQVLLTQLAESRAVPEVPGSYFLGRHLNNAFRAVVISGKDLKDTLEKYGTVIDNELTVKRREFGMEEVAQ